MTRSQFLKKKVWRSFNINMPPQLIPIYHILQRDYNKVLNNDYFREELLKLELYDENRKKIKNGDLWKKIGPLLQGTKYIEIEKVNRKGEKRITRKKVNTNDMVSEWPISQKGWYLRIFMDNLIRLLRSQDEKIMIYTLLQANGMKINDDLFDLLNQAKIFTTRGNIENIKDSNKKPELPRKDTFELNFSSTDSQTCATIAPNHFLINSYEDQYIEYKIELPLSIRENLTGEIARPKFLCRNKDNQYIGICSYKVRVENIPLSYNNVLGVDIGKIKLYSATRLSLDGTYSDEFLPTEKLNKLYYKVETLYNEREKVIKKFNEIENLKKNNKEFIFESTQNKQDRRKLQIASLSKKISNLKQTVMTNLASELVNLAITEKSKIIKVENLTWLKAMGGKWNFSYFQTRLSEIAELYNIIVLKVSANNTSKENPITKEIGTLSNRDVIFSDGFAIDRDRLASINIALKSHKKDPRSEKRKINELSLNYLQKQIKKPSTREWKTVNAKQYLKTLNREHQIVIFPPVQASEIYGIWNFSYNVASDYCSILLPKFFGKYKQ